MTQQEKDRIMKEKDRIMKIIPELKAYRTINEIAEVASHFLG